MNRRHFLAAGTILALACGLPLRAQAGTATETLPAGKVFAYLSNYYSLPPAERAHFRMAYVLFARSGKIDQISLTLTIGAASLPIRADSAGTLSPLPTAQQLKGDVILTRPDNMPANAYGVGLTFTPSAVLQQTMEAGSLNLSIVETLKGAKKAAGLLSVAVPNFDRIAAFGVNSGQVRLASGEVKSLPVVAAFTDKDGQAHKARVMYVPADWPTAQSVNFNTVPTRLIIMPKG